MVLHPCSQQVEVDAAQLSIPLTQVALCGRREEATSVSRQGFLLILFLGLLVAQWVRTLAARPDMSQSLGPTWKERTDYHRQGVVFMMVTSLVYNSAHPNT